jgi:hypothetical protein
MPRIQYKKVTVVIPDHYPIEQVSEIWDRNLNRGFTFSSKLEDAGFGDLDQRNARIYGIDPEQEDGQEGTVEYFQENYPGVVVQFLRNDGVQFRSVRTRPDRQKERGAVVRGGRKHVFHLLHSSLNVLQAKAVFLEFWKKGEPVGWIADEGGIGTWRYKSVVCHGWPEEEQETIQMFFKYFYPKVKVQFGEIPPFPWDLPEEEPEPEEPEPVEPNPGDRVITVSDSGSGSDSLPGETEGNEE